MRNIYRFALVSVLAFSLAAAPSELFAQARRGTSATTASSSQNRSASSASRSASSSASRSTSATAPSRSTSASPSRSTSVGTSASASRSSSSSVSSGASRAGAGRSTASASSSTSRSTSASAAPDNQVRRGTSSSSSTGTASRSTTAAPSRSTSAGTSASTSRSSSSSSAASGTTARRTVTPGTSGTSGTSASSSANTTAPSRKVTPARSTAGTTATSSAAQTGSSSRAARGTNRSTTSSRGLTSASSSASRAAGARAGQTVNKAGSESRSALNYSGGRGSGSRNLRLDDNRNLNRIHPRERDFMTYDMPGSFFRPAPHFFGYRIHTLPPRYRHITHWGVDYYYYDNVYYRRYGTYYVVCRPPFGIALDIALNEVAFAAVRFSYYHNVYRAYDILDDNYRTIAEQNRIIAQNNAAIAAQNSALALNSHRATSADEIAHALGLVQSYADINTEYYYEDGVFYTVNKKGRYEVIVPPAGALVDELPDDYDTVVLNGVEYYKVEDTVYRLVLVEGVPALEVLGQMYGSMARQYDYYN